MDEKEKNKDIKVKTYVDDVLKAMDSSSTINTYVTDITKAVEGNRGDVIKKMIEEQEMYQNSKKGQAPKSQKNKIFALFTVIFILLTIGVFVFIKQKNKDTTVPVILPEYVAPIFVDEEKYFKIDGLTKEQIQRGIFDEVKKSSVKLGGVEGIYFTINEKIIGLRQLMSSMGTGLVLDETAAIINDNFLVGVVNSTDGYVDVFISSEDEAPSVPEPMPVVEEGKLVTLNNSVFFKTGTVKFINEDAKEKAKLAISDFLNGIDFTTTKINVIGTYSVERPWSQNEALAEARREVGLDILDEVLTTKYTPEDISKITIESSARGVSVNDTRTKEEIDAMTKDELNTAIDGAQGIQYFAQAKTKPVAPPVVPVETPLTPPVVNAPNISATSGLEFFMLLKTSSFYEVFPSMRSWESSMLTDLQWFFGIDIAPADEYLLVKEFQDIVVQNRNARALYDNQNRLVFMYIFADNKSVIITRSEATAREIILRLAASDLKK